MTTDSNEIYAPQLVTKQSGEKRKLLMDFTNWIDTGVTISSTTLESEKNSGEESDLIITDSTISGKKVIFNIRGGTHAQNYKIKITVNLSDGQILIGNGMLRVLDR